MILVSTDGTELSDKAVHTAAKLAKQLNTSVLGIIVVKSKGAESALKALEEVKDVCEKTGTDCEVAEIVFVHRQFYSAGFGQS